MPKTVDGDSASAFHGGNRPSSQMTHRVLLPTDIPSSITGPDSRVIPVLNHHVTRGVVPPAHGLRQSLSRFCVPWVPPTATLQGPRAQAQAHRGMRLTRARH